MRALLLFSQVNQATKGMQLFVIGVNAQESSDRYSSVEPTAVG